MKSPITNITCLYGADGKTVLQAEIKKGAAAEIEELVSAEKPLEIDIHIKRKKRSLDANAYCWVLINKLSERVGLPPDEVYRSAVKEVGGNYYTIPVRYDALSEWKRVWTAKGIGWIAEEIGESKLQGYVNTRNFYGSSEYNSAQMARLINIIVEDCKEQGIETASPQELQRLSEEWGGKNE